MAKILVVFYSTYGHVAELARNVAKGAEEAGAEVKVRRIAETLPDEVLDKMHALEAQKHWHPEFPVVEHDDLLWADGIIWGSPTRYGGLPSQTRAFIDTLGQFWMQNSLVGKVASAFTSTASQHGGNETTILSGFIPFFFHMGLVIVGLPYTYVGQMGVDELRGGSPYGMTTMTGGDGGRMPSEGEKLGAHYQGKHVAEITTKLVGGKVVEHVAPVGDGEGEKKVDEKKGDEEEGKKAKAVKSSKGKPKDDEDDEDDEGKKNKGKKSVSSKGKPKDDEDESGEEVIDEANSDEPKDEDDEGKKTKNNKTTKGKDTKPKKGTVKGKKSDSKSSKKGSEEKGKAKKKTNDS